MLIASVQAFVFAATRASSSSVVCTPLCSISARRMICTGRLVSTATRLMREPTTSTLSSTVTLSCATAPVPEQHNASADQRHAA